MITLIDYGIGNIRSIEKAFQAIGVEVMRTDQPEHLAQAERLVLPGVGAFGACAAEIRRRGLEQPILDAVERGTPLLGVCVGMQLLFETGEEHGIHHGLGLLPGRVVRFQSDTLKIPHMGWNTLHVQHPSPLLEGIAPGDFVYFVHSFHVIADEASDVTATTLYGENFPAIVGRNNVHGVQFHPEKSQQTGLRILKNFVDFVPNSS